MTGAHTYEKENTVRIILFDVDHGFCAFIRTPNGHTIMLDCGKSPIFSPTEYLLRNRVCTGLSKLIVSHQHDDHIEDFPRVVTRLSPQSLLAPDLNWKFIKNQNPLSSHASLDAYVSRKESVYTGGWAADPDFGMKVQTFWLPPNRAQQISSSVNSAINNCSYVTVATVRGREYQPKFVFGGDMEEAGWEELLAMNAAFRAAVSGVWFYFVSHHGHKSGFSTKLFQAMGKPALNLISVRHKDDSRDARYSADECSNGWPIDGEMRKMLSTTCDGSIFIDVDNESGLPSVSTHILAANMKDSTLLPPPIPPSWMGGYGL